MQPGLKRVSVRIMVLLCVLLLCALPTLASAGNLYSTRYAQALGAGLQIINTVKLELGDGIVPVDQAPTFDELLDVIQIQVAVAQPENGLALDLAILVSGQKVLTGIAYFKEDGINLETSALPGKTLFMSYDAIEGLAQELDTTNQFQGSMDMIGKISEAFVPYGDMIGKWVGDLGNTLVAGNTPVAATTTRDAVASSITFRLEPTQMSDLLHKLAIQFSTDTALQDMLHELMKMTQEDMAQMAAALPLLVQSIEPGPSPIEIIMFNNDADEVVGIEATIPQPFGTSGFFGRFVYDRLTTDKFINDSYKMAARWADGGELEGDLSLRSGEKQPSPMEQIQLNQGKKVDIIPGTSTSMFLSGKFTPGAGQSPYEIQAMDNRTITGDDQQETVDDEFSFMLIQPMDTSQTGIQSEIAQFMPGTTLNMGYVLNSETKALIGDDFSDETKMQIKLEGKDVVIFHVSTETKAYQAPFSSNNTVVNLIGMSEEESVALTEELNAGLMQALIEAMAYLPPELMAMFSTGF